ncbi:ParA family partition ATPase [Burkholderia gladioli]|uniref:ParA family partition ATPase n=1 Tax=Burkholderia gladioli TaxID=28095 RepID=UPI00163FAF82|nr:ParA family partition ATPase [Burkholderia gladioli]
MTAKIFAIANQKGGVGKSTITVSVASDLAGRGFRVLGIDADPQNTLLQWSAASGEDEDGLSFPVANLAASGKMIHREIKKYINDYDFIVIDCPPSVEDPRPAVVLMIADLVVMPTSSSPTDFWSSRGFIQLIEQARVTNDALKAVWLLNKAKPKRLLTKALGKAIADTGIPVLKTSLSDRESFKQAAAYGVAVSALSDKGARAARDEIKAITDEILEFLDVRQVREEAV